MDFAKILDLISTFFDERGVRHALVGGFALAAHGLVRATQDIDLIVDSGAQDIAVDFFESLGYETVYRSRGYSNHEHPLAAMGHVDLIYVDPPTADILFGGAAFHPLFGRSIRIPRPEHLVAMKLHAMKSDPTRTFREMADLQALMGLPGVDLDEIRGYFKRYGLEARFHEILEITRADRP